jgi:hypothetical protein
MCLLAVRTVVSFVSATTQNVDGLAVATIEYTAPETKVQSAYPHLLI